MKIPEATKNYIRPDQPFGPIRTEKISDLEVVDALFDKENKINEAINLSPSFIVGRRGAGKTALLKERLFKEDDISIELKTFDAFSNVIETINKISKEKVLFVDHIANIWEFTFWNAIFIKLISKYEENDKYEDQIITLQAIYIIHFNGRKHKYRASF